MVRRYYQLVASLPPLPHLAHAERLPISPQRLAERLRLLDPRDAADLERAQALVSWQAHPSARSEPEATELADRILPALESDSLRAVVAERLELRTVMAALRRRRRGEPAPVGQRWGVGERARWIERHWNEPDFGLGSVLPWVPHARDLLARGEATALETLLMTQTWTRLVRLAERHPFQFEDVYSYVFRWDIVQRRLTYDAPAAGRRFLTLVSEAIDAQLP